MPNGGGHPTEGRIGFCPHCQSSNIRIRRSRHRSQLWRCRSCNRTFNTPIVRLAYFDEEDAHSFVAENEIRRLERRVRRGGNRRHRGNRRRNGNQSVIVAVIILSILAVAGGVLWWLIAGDARSVTTPEQSGSIGSIALAMQTPSTTKSDAARTAVPAIAPSQTAMSVPTPTPVPTLASTPAPVSTETPTRVGTPTPVATPTPVTPPELRYIDEKEYMLALINAERKKAGVSAVTLGENIAAQLHAESALENCFSSHWGLDGLKPYMRYSLARGYQSNGENGHGLDYCIRASDGYSTHSGIRLNRHPGILWYGEERRTVQSGKGFGCADLL